ncbi:MAG: hypothetical protein GXP39_12190 [Chloroflexi bacterium]|nr:hypothetical protein [Chloroflexota bacterium]
MSARLFYMISGTVLIIIPISTLSLLEATVGKALLIAVAAGILRTQSILDVPRYAFAGSVVIELFGLCVGILLLSRAILHR